MQPEHLRQAPDPDRHDASYGLFILLGTVVWFVAPPTLYWLALLAMFAPDQVSDHHLLAQWWTIGMVVSGLGPPALVAVVSIATRRWLAAAVAAAVLALSLFVAVRIGLVSVDPQQVMHVLHGLIRTTRPSPRAPGCIASGGYTDCRGG